MIRRLTIVLLIAFPLLAQKKEITYDALYDPTQRVYFDGTVQSGFDWIDDTTFIWPKSDEKGDFVEWRLFDVATGKQRAFFDKAKLQKALEGAGLAADVAKKAIESDELKFNAKKNVILLDLADDLYAYYVDREVALRITSAPGAEEEATFSPDGKKIAFIRDNNLFVADLGGRERQLTTDGSAQILNGKLDYVYQEEVYGRGVWKGYWWSPDSSRIAFLQLDERPVPEFTIVDHIPYRLALNVYAYPKAGDPNPRVKLLVTPVSGGAVTTVDNERYSAGEFLIVNVAWHDETLTYQVQNREQTWLDLVLASADGTSRAVIHETTKAWVDPIANPVWREDGTFLWQSERSGFRHIYHYKADGSLIRQVTNGEWEVRELHGADGSSIYFSGTERSPIGQDVYRVKLDGSGLQRLSAEAGTHIATFSPSMQHYADKWSDLRTPDQVRVYRADGKVASVVDENKVAALAAYDLPRAELLQVKTRDGFTMEAMIIKPPNFDPTKKYPALASVYGGPASAATSERFVLPSTNTEYGFLVLSLDSRAVPGMGKRTLDQIYLKLGQVEMDDMAEGVKALWNRPYFDRTRVGIHGSSYGGYSSAMEILRHPEVFAAASAASPPTDWRNYDSIYTERYMWIPEENKDGYDTGAAMTYANNLKGRLLIYYGTADNNVHPSNTLQLIKALQEAGKSIDVQVGPDLGHSAVNQDRMMEFFIDALRPNP